jgi:hypothetical protein
VRSFFVRLLKTATLTNEEEMDGKEIGNKALAMGVATAADLGLISLGRAAKRLGIPEHTLRRHWRKLGLTCVRPEDEDGRIPKGAYRYFLADEIERRS